MSKTFTFSERIRQDILLLSINEDFSASVDEIRSEFNIPESNSEVDYDDTLLIHSNKEFTEELGQLMKKYCLPESHEFALTDYILYDNIDVNNNYAENFWHLNPNIKTAGEDNCILLKIYPNTTLKDIQRNWAIIKKAKDQILKQPLERKKRCENLERDILIHKLRNKGKKMKDIAKIINDDKKFNTQLLTYEEIPKIIARLKEKAKTIIPPKET